MDKTLVCIKQIRSLFSWLFSAQVLLAHSPDANHECAESLLVEAIDAATRAVAAGSRGQGAEVAKLLERMMGSRRQKKSARRKSNSNSNSSTYRFPPLPPTS